jgi:hypothetical protein
MDEDRTRRKRKCPAPAHSHWKCVKLCFIVGAMKAAFLLGLVLFPLGALQAADTAYSALRVLGKRDGQDILNHVVELRGHDGMPQPSVWKIVIDDPRARGGVRELEVQHGKIVSERTPTHPSGSGAMNFNQLNLDSEGAFTVANQEAQKTNVFFDHVDYLLKAGTGGGAPVWELDLSDGKHGRVGSVEIAADSGTVLRRQLDMHRPADDDHAYLDDHHNPPPQYSSRDSGDEGYSRPGEPFRNVPDFFHRLGNRFKKREHQLENFFTGKPFSSDDSSH